MNVPLSKISGSPREIEVAGKTYKMGQITLDILVQVEAWARDLPYDRVKKNLEKFPEASEDQKQKWFDKADELSMCKDAMQREIESTAGVMFMVRKCFEVHHPDMSDEIFAMVINTVGLSALQGFMDSDNNIDSVTESSGEDEKKTK